MLSCRCTISSVACVLHVYVIHGPELEANDGVGDFSICWPLLCRNDLPYQIITSVLLMRLVAYIVRIVMDLSDATVSAYCDQQYLA
jgi:hypothetical protein